MGAFDSYHATVPCPSCGDLHWVSGQTKFFDPDYDDQRTFEPGEPQQADFANDSIASFAADGWIRIRARTGEDRCFTLLADFDDLCGCDCGMGFIVLLHFELAPGTVTMQQIELLEHQDLADRVDFAEAIGLWAGDLDAYQIAIAAANARSFTERAAWLRERLDDRFAFTDDEPRETTWSTLVGPTQCEACGDVRERCAHTLLTDTDHPVSFFGPGWTKNVIFLGDRIPFDDGWLADDVDRGRYFRVRHPVGERLRVLGQLHQFGCHCGAGRGRTVAHFERRAGALELVELTMRAVRSRADLHDIDFVEGHSRQPFYVGGEPRTRALVLASVLA